MSGVPRTVNVEMDGAPAGTRTLTLPLKRRMLCCSSSRSKRESDTKAELNRRSQTCEVLTGTGISRRGRWTKVLAHDQRNAPFNFYMRISFNVGSIEFYMQKLPGLVNELKSAASLILIHSFSIQSNQKDSYDHELP